MDTELDTGGEYVVTLGRTEDLGSGSEHSVRTRLVYEMDGQRPVPVALIHAHVAEHRFGLTAGEFVKVQGCVNPHALREVE